jgi:hypothetical protein
VSSPCRPIKSLLFNLHLIVKAFFGGKGSRRCPITITSNNTLVYVLGGVDIGKTK